MEMYNIDKLHLKAMISSYNIDIPDKVQCILDTYNLKLVVLHEPQLEDELKSLIEETRNRKDTFMIFVIDNEPMLKHALQFTEEKGVSATATQTMVYLIARSYYFYAFYFNKGMRAYALNNTEFIRAIVSTLITLVAVSARKSYIALRPEDMSDIKIICTIFALYCILGLHKKSEVLKALNHLDIGVFNKFRVLIFYNHFIKHSKSSKSLAHILGEIQGWNKVAQDTLIINITRILGPTLTRILVTCDAFEDELITYAWKLSNLYFYYKIGMIHKEANVGSLNKLTQFEFAKILKNLDKFTKMIHYGRC